MTLQQGKLSYKAMTPQDPSQNGGAVLEPEGALMVEERPWHPDYPACLGCGRVDSPYAAKGRCRLCYLKHYREKHRKKIQRQKRQWWARNAKRMARLRRRKKS